MRIRYRRRCASYDLTDTMISFDDRKCNFESFECEWKSEGNKIFSSSQKMWYDKINVVISLTHWELSSTLSMTWHYLAVPGITWNYLELPGITWHYLAIPGITRHYSELLGITRNYSELLGITRHKSTTLAILIVILEIETSPKISF